MVIRPTSTKGVKEQNSIYLPPFPQVATLPKMKLDIYHHVAVCAQDKHQRLMLRWLQEVEDPNARFEDFEEPGVGFETLDGKLATALI